MSRLGEDTAGVPFPPPVAFAAPLLLLGILEWLAPTALLASPWRWVVGALLALAGAAVNVAAAATQRRAGTDFDPYRPSTRIVSHGPYRFTRNPMYVGFALFSAGLAFLVGSLWMLLAVPIGIVLIDRLVIVREERYLEGKFGEDYLAYKRRVRRWL